MILIIIIILPTNERAISSLEQNDHVKYLGVMIDDKISRKYHISFFSSRIPVFRNSRILFKLRHYFFPFQLAQYYKLIYSYLTAMLSLFGAMLTSPV